MVLLIDCLMPSGHDVSRMKTLLLLLLMLFPALGLASDQDTVRRAVAEGRLQPLAEIITRVQDRYPGRIVDVELERRSGGLYIYEIELLMPDHSKIEVKVDGTTGEFLQSDGSERAAYRPLPELLRQVQARLGGHLIDVELEHGSYQIELMQTGGNRVLVIVDPVTGELADNSTVEAELDALQPMADVIERMLVRYPGTLTEAELERTAEGRYYYELEIEDASGRERSVHVDALSGQVLREDAD